MQGIEAAIGAATYDQLDDIARGMWRSYGQGELDDLQANALSGAIEARRRALAPSTREMSHKPATTRHGPPRRPPCRAPDRSRSIARRRQLAASGAVPGSIAANFTTGELAVLSVIARELQRSDGFAWCMDKLAAVAGVSRTTARNAIRRAQALGLISVVERRHNRWRSDTNILTIVSAEWRQWLRLGGGCKKPMPTNNQIILPVENSGEPRLQRAQPVYSGHGKTDRRPAAHLRR